MEAQENGEFAGLDFDTIVEQEKDVIQKHPSEAIGLAFSGGGIRSAIFNLGVLQTLAKFNLLREIDYLSTVSGGGYIGCWLSALIHRKSKQIAGPEPANQQSNSEPAVSELNRNRSGQNEIARKALEEIEKELGSPNESSAVTFLRDYSNYLTPRASLFSTDTLAAVANLLRNFYLNFVTLIALLCAVLLLPRLLTTLFDTVHDHFPCGWSIFVLLSIALLILSVIAINKQLQVESKSQDDTPSVVVKVLVPSVLAAFILSYILNWLVNDSLNGESDLSWVGMPGVSAFWAGSGAICYFLFWWIAHLCVRDRGEMSGTSEDGRVPGCLIRWKRFLVRCAPFLAGAVGGWLLYWLPWLYHEVDRVYGKWLALSVGVALMLKIFSVMIVLHIGLVGDEFSEQNREWWGRLGGIVLMAALVWLGLFGIAVYGPVVFIWAKTWMVSAGIGTWLLSTIAGVLLGRSDKTGKENSKRWIEFIAQIAPHIFIVGLLILLASVFHYASTDVPPYPPETSIAVIAPETLAAMGEVSPLILFNSFAGCILVFFVLATQIDVNLFSMHHFYHNRLSRCYLGASNLKRDASKFTGFDPADDEIGLAECQQRPFPIINTALNLVHGDQLAWQQRKAASFAFTPLYTGFRIPESVKSGKENTAKQIGSRYRPTDDYMEGPKIGTAMAISGAAASPNMGYHTSPALAFLLTLFNVRLGRWCGNPADEKAWRQLTPNFGGSYLIRELFGFTDDKSPFVYLSDGGHFENLGIYELVRRGCRYIIACDAGQDEKLTFEDLGNAIRKCYTDLGIRIDIDVSPLRREAASRYSRQHCVVGTIHYEVKDKQRSPGTLLYIKASLTGNEPSDILQYAATEAAFPHQSTADQWFDEAQFESYRKLGAHIGRTALENASLQAPLDQSGCRDKEEFFIALRHTWFPPSRANQKAFSRHAKMLEKLFNELRGSSKLRFLDGQIYPEWRAFTGDLPDIEKKKLSMERKLPDDYEERREGFYFCNSLIQLMESVYLDLNLEELYDHPDNRGWMNLFRHWSHAEMVIVTWAISAFTYGVRFQTFCERHLEMRLG
ncbi:MAG: hypothetical protein ACU843_11605, partial [Gammaproteobacteria bacterium]